MKTKILKSIYKRHLKYKWEVFLSRHEHQKFWLTEWEMRKQLRLLRRNWLLTIWKRYCWEKRFSNLYKLTDELLEYIKEKLKKVRKSFDIVKFNNETKVENIKNLLGIRWFWKNFVISKDKDYKYTYNSQFNIITKWSKSWWEHKWFNLFNWLKELFNLDTYLLIKELYITN